MTRDDARLFMRKLWRETVKDSFAEEAFEIAIKALEQPERKKGKWLQKSKPLEFCTEWWYECSECGSKPPNDRYGHPNYLSDYCPNCGADMRGGDDGE